MGIIYITPFAAQIALQGVSLLYLNDVFMIPFFGVPPLTVLHVYLLYQLLSTRAVEKHDVNLIDGPSKTTYI